MSVLKVALCCLLAIGMVAAEVVPVNDAEDVEETDEGASELEADTPTRQAQRSMLAEREAATAVHREEDVLGMRMMEVEEGAETDAEKRKKKPASRGRRVSGAARSFLPNDKMCVMCQFLTERIALDLLGRASPAIAGPYGGYSYGGDGNPPFAMIGGVAPAGKSADAFIEMTDEDADEEADTEEEADEIEGEEEADEEAEEESEDLALLQISEEEEEEADEEADEESEEEADEESDSEDESEEEDLNEAVIEDATEEEEAASDWTTPLYSLAETDASTSVKGEENGDFQTPQYIDSVYQSNDAEEAEMTEEDQTETDEGTTDSSEPTFFESAATVGTNDDTEWTTPEYANEKAEAPVATAPAETAFIEVAEAEGWTTPQYSDAAVEASGKKEYARILATEEEEAEEEEPALIEQSAENEVKFFRPRIIRSRRSRLGRKGPFRVFFHTPRRYRAADAIVPRPRWNRHGHHTPHRKMARVIGTAAFRMAEHAAYDRLETYCSTRLPEVYGRYCRPMLRNFRHITEGLRYGDRVGQVCMQVNLCKKSSYIAKSPHVQHGVW